MVAIKGITGIPEPTPERPTRVREEKAKESAKTSTSSDGILISSEAQAAASITKAIRSSAAESEVRTDRVAAARERIERGEYKNPEVVAKVAQRISKYLP